ncbi:MAG: helix-turn-helix transcriptional regulator [Planctomycetota bacterium]
MRHAPTPLQNEVRSRRLAARMKQAELGDLVGKTQSAISMWENGDGAALSADAVAAICRRFGIDADDYPDDNEVRARRQAERKVVKGCLVPGCFSQTPLRTPRFLLRPRFTRVAHAGRQPCVECGELLADACPCGHPLEPGSICPGCHRPYVDLGGLADLESWFEDRLVAIRHNLREEVE